MGRREKVLIDSQNEIMGQCIDSGTAQRGLWQAGNERYHVLYTHSVPEPTCYGMPGDLAYSLGGNPDFDWVIPSEVVQTVCGGMSARASSRDLNAGARWVVRGSKTGLAEEEDYTLCKQAMVCRPGYLPDDDANGSAARPRSCRIA
jgi:hypothetical protein